MPAGASSQGERITWELIRKRNFVERLKHEKGGLDVIHDLPAMIEAGYEAVPEEDFVRMQWYGLYHDKPKVGYFMLRVKLPGGVVTPAKLRVIGELSQRFGRGYGELTTRQNIQLHWIELAQLPEVLRLLEEGGMTTTGACGDNVRAITGCPVAGLDREEPFEVQGLIDEATRFFIANREYSDLPRKHKITISACPHQCNAPAEEQDHTGIHPQKQEGLFYAGVPVHLGLMNGETMIRLAGLVESWGGELRITRRQNFILANIPEARLDAAVREVEALGFPLE